MNYIQSKVVNWGFKLLTLVVLVGTLFSVANGQVEIQRLKIEREAAKEKARQECDLRIGYETDKLKTRCKRDVELLASALEIEKKKYNLIVSAQDEEIMRLQNIARDSSNHDLWWFSGGVVIGVVTSIAIFFAATEIAK